MIGSCTATATPRRIRPRTCGCDGNDGPLDRTFFVAPPGRRPTGADRIGVHDAVGNMLTWANDGVRRFSYTMSWENHEKLTDIKTWPPQGSNGEVNGYYAIGARCIFE